MNREPNEIELENSPDGFEPIEDKRPKIEEPPPVRLVAVEDCSLSAAAGLERDLDAFYVGLLGFEREEDGGGIVYRAENFRLRIAVIERPQPREDYHPLGIVVPSLFDLMQRLADAEIEFVRQRGLMPGVESLLLSDPAGNPLEITQFMLAI
jgi:hypothetical protein